MPIYLGTMRYNLGLFLDKFVMSCIHAALKRLLLHRIFHSSQTTRKGKYQTIKRSIKKSSPEQCNPPSFIMLLLLVVCKSSASILQNAYGSIATSSRYHSMIVKGNLNASRWYGIPSVKFKIRPLFFTRRLFFMKHTSHLLLSSDHSSLCQSLFL